MSAFRRPARALFVSIFVGLFAAYIFVSYSKPDMKIVLLLLLGFLTSFMANVFRMALIVVVAYYYGPGNACLETHEYAAS